MKFLCQRFATLLLSFTLASIASGSAQVPYILVHSLNDPATNALPYAKQGATVAVDGNFAVVGAPSPSDTEPSQPSPGRVKVYDTASGVLLHTLMAPKPAIADLIGFGVAVSGNLVVVGASRDDSGATDAGSSYVFDLAGTTPAVPLLILTNPTPAINDRFGSPVAISGTRVLLGSVWEDNGGQDTGSVYVYDIGSARPTVPVMVLTNPAPAANERFGSPLAISGSRAVISVRFTNTLSSSVGGAYVYDLGSTTPTAPIFTLTNPTPAAGDNFGTSVAISGNLVVVGASNDDTGAADAGSAYVYDLASSTPAVPAVTLTNPSPVAGELFGISVAVAVHEW